MSEWLGRNRKALAIFRVSSNKQQQDGASHEVQEAEIRAYCERTGLHLTEVRAIVESAKDSDNRKKFKAALDHALTHDIRHVVFYLQDRESRNLTDTEWLEKLVRGDLLVLHYAHDRKVLHQKSSNSEFMMRNVSAVFATQFSWVLKERVEDAMLKKAESGWFPNSQPPLGYKTKRIEDGSAIIVRDPNEAIVRWVQREFELRAKGYSYHRIRDQIVSEGLVPAGRVATYWPRMVEHRLHNPFYEGRFRWKQKEYDGKHELIIPPEIMRAVKQIERGAPKVRRVDDGEHGLLAGGDWFRCGSCGCAVVYEVKTKTYRNGKTQRFHYYRCSNGKRAHGSKVYVPEAWVWAQLERALDAIMLTPETAAALAKGLNVAHEKAAAQAARKIEDAERALKAAQAREDQATDLLMAGTLDHEGFIRQRDRARANAEKARAELRVAITARDGKARESARSVIELCMRAKELYNSRPTPERRSLLQKLLSNPILDGRTVRFNWRKPFGLLAELSSDEDWCTRCEEFLTQVSGLQGGLLEESRL
jgi:DNA invertase Pin-like site-specific DNA recombinase